MKKLSNIILIGALSTSFTHCSHTPKAQPKAVKPKQASTIKNSPAKAKATPPPQAQNTVAKPSPAPLPTAAKAKSSFDEVVDLSAMDASPASPTTAPTATPTLAAPNSIPVPSNTTVESKIPLSAPANTGQIAPNFRFYFDFWLINRPGITDLTFQNVHTVSMVEYAPRNDILFSTELSSSPRFYEIEIRPNPKLRLRAGKIWIPFDDMSPHNMFGGRINTSQLISGSHLFLPNIWTELGVAAHYQLYSNFNFKLDSALYVTNGVGSGGKNLYNGTTNYPNFSDASVSSVDNNRDKAIGGRLQGTLFNRLTLGASYYTARWNDQVETNALKTDLMGADARYKLGGFEIRGGLASGTIQLKEGGVAKRGGAYGEASQKFGPTQAWRGSVMGGKLQSDDRVKSADDQTDVGVGIFYRPDLIQYSIEHSMDLDHTVPKPNHEMTWLRMAISL